jgi:hypothetical protein
VERGPLSLGDRLNVQRLTDCIVECFDLSSSGAVPSEFRGEFLVLGKRLRRALVKLVSAKFREGTDAIQAANLQIAVVNRRLKAEAKRLNDFADAVRAGSALVGTLDGLLTVAVAFA